MRVRTSEQYLSRALQGLPPFTHSELSEIKCYEDVYAFADLYKEPCVIIGGDPTFRIGALAEIMMSWSPATSGSQGVIAFVGKPPSLLTVSSLNVY